MTRRRNSQQRKEPESMSSATELMDMDTSKMSEIEFRIVIMKSIARLEKSISDRIESLRAEVRSNQAELRNTMNEMQSKLDILNSRVHEAEDRMSDLEDKLIERRKLRKIEIGS